MDVGFINDPSCHEDVAFMSWRRRPKQWAGEREMAHRDGYGANCGLSTYWE
jgi:hypothetical protein